MNKKIETKSKFGLIFDFEQKGKRSRAEPSRAKLQILQLELWLEPARLGLITIIQRTAVPFQRHCAVGSIEIQIFENPGLNNQSILDSDTLASDHIL